MRVKTTMLSWLFGLVLGIFLVAGLSQTAFAQDPPGSTCENPLVVDPVGTPLVNFAINSEAYGNNYTSAMITPASSYLNGNDIVFQFTLTETSFINASIAGVYTGLIFVGTCPNLATPAPRLAFAGSATGAVVPQFSLVAGTYFMIASTWPAPQFTDMVINLSATIIQEQPNLVVNPSTLDVGMAVPGLDVVSKKVTLANQGLSDAVVSQSGIVFSGANADDFSVTFPETTVKSLNPITTVMDKTIAGGALPAIIDNAGNNRGAGFNGTHVFVASRQNGNHVYYWDVNNPSADPLELDLTGVTGGTFTLSDLNVVGNHIFVSNMVFVGGVFKVYHWNGVAAQPTVLLEFTSDARLGDAFTVIGDPATSALLVASGHATKNFYAWEIVNGAIPNTTPTIYTINEIEINASFGRLTKVPNENMFIASGSGMGVLLLDNQMNVLAQVPKAWFPWWAMYSQVFHSSGQRYLAYSHVKSPPNENMLYVLDISEGATVAEALQILAASTFADKVVHTLNLGTIGNGNASVGFDLVDDMFMAYSAGNGFAVQHFTNVDPLVIPFGTSKTLTVHFDPAVPGSSSADMTINYNSTNSPANVSLTGTGYLPYTAFSQNFDEVAPIPAGWMPGGWSGIVQSTVPLAVVDVRNIGAPTSLPNHVRLFNSTDVNSVLTLVSPAAVNLTNSWVRFSSKMSSTAHTGNVQVGYLTNRNDPSTFVMVGTVPVTGTYAQYNVSFLGSGLTFPETAYIGFRFVHTLASRTLYIDDIFYEAVPTLPVFTANKTEVAFGTNVFINETAANTLQISNTGAGTLTINQADVTITGADAAAFSIVYPGTQTWPIALTFGQTFTFQLRFAPTEARAYVASLNIQDNIGGKAVNAIPLLGSGYDATIQPGFLFDFAGTTFPPQDWRRFKGLFGTEPVLPTTEAIWVHKRFANNPDLPAFNSANINLYGTSRRHWLMSPPINLGDGSVDYQLEFDLALTFWNQTTPVTLAPEQKFAVVISTDGGLTWSMDNVLQWWNNNTPISNTGDHIVLDLSAYSGRVMLGFYGEMTVSTAGTIDYDLFVRNVAVTEFDPCASFTVPMVENFDTTPVLEVPQCWTVETNTVAWRVSGTGGAVGNSAPNSIATFYNSTNAKNDWFFTPGLPLTAGESYDISFNVKAPGWAGTGEKLAVKWGFEPNAAAMTGGTIYENTNMLFPQYVNVSETFVPATTGVYYFGWHAFTPADVDYIAVDDISIIQTPSVDLALTQFYQSSGFPGSSKGFNDAYIIRQARMSENAPDNTSALPVDVIGVAGTDVNNTELIIGNSTRSLEVSDVEVTAVVENVAGTASAYVLDWSVNSTTQTAYTGSVVAPGASETAILTYTPANRGSFITNGSITVADDGNTSNNSAMFRMLVYPDNAERTVYDRGDNVVDAWIGWGGTGTTPMKAAVRYTANEDITLAGVDYITRTLEVTSGTFVVEVWAAGATPNAPGALLYSQEYTNPAYFSAAGAYLHFAFLGENLPSIAAGSDYWISVLAPLGIPNPGAAHNTGFTPGRSFYYVPSTDTWAPLVLTTERAWLMRAVHVEQSEPSSLLFAENFDYPLGSLLTDNGYTAHSGAGTNPIDVTNGLDFAGYIGSGIGGAANLDNTGEDVHQSFEPQTTGNVYAAFVVKTEPTNSAGYFFHFGIEPWATTYFTRVWVNATGDGIGIGTTVDAYAPITAGEPTLVVAKFNMETKVSSLYVFNTFPTEEPATPFATFTETSSAIVNVGGLGLRQYNAAQKVIVDGIRVATTWEDAVMAGEVTPQPSIAVAPESLSETLVLGTSSAHVVTVSNTGSSALEFELTVSTGSTKSAEAISYVANFELPTGGDRSNPQVSPVVATKEVLSSGASMRSSFSEGFDDITTLPAAGWALINNSAPVGTTSWFQASATAPFPAHSGAATSYIGANFNNTAGTGTISNWLLTPETALANGHTMSFWTRVP
ncbi:MAG: DUF4623 domain-containing protein, partial [Bacteroidetes bacterium]|nr:DUF4623 domain-containing protein [Bacteroidota bacterium]